MIINKTIGSVIEFVPRVIHEILDELEEKMTLLPHDRLHLNLILEEAISNAIQHGNQFDTSCKVKISLEAKKNKIEIRVKDEGPGFNYKNLPKNLKAVNKALSPRGRGLFIMQKTADQVSFNSSGSEICILQTIGLPKKTTPTKKRRPAK